MNPIITKTSSIFIIAMCISSAAFAQTVKSTNESDGDIVVTAQKRESSLLQVAAPISVISGERIERRGVTDFEGLLQQLSGVSITSDYGGSSSKVISIRGVGGSDDYRPNGSSSVAMHVDNIYQSSNLFLAVPFFDIERAEVLKGPQGTLYGRNSTAGVVNLITRSKSDVLNGYVTTQYESYDRVRAEGAIGIPLAQGVGLRLAGTVDQGGGFQTGMGAGSLAGKVYFPAVGAVPDPGVRKGWGDRDLYAGRATLDVAFSPDTTLIVKAFGSRDRGESQQLDSTGGVSNGGFVEPDNDPYTFYSNRYPKRKIDVFGASGTLQHKFSEALTMDVVAGYQGGNRSVGGSGYGTPQRNFDYDFTDRVRQHSLEVRLSEHDGGLIDWVVGGYYLGDKVDFRTNLIALDTFGTNLVSDYHQTRTSKAMFGQVDVNVTRRVTLSGGLRYTRDDATFVGSTTDTNPYGASIVPTALPAVPVYFDNDFDNDNLSGRATIAFRPTDTTNIYASVGKGYKAGGFDGSTIFSKPEALPFKSENVWAYEGGFKFAGHQGLFLNVDAFYYDFDNLQANTTTIIAGQSTSANVRTNVAKARLYGIDGAIGATLLHSGPHRLSVDGGVTLLRSKILEFDSSNPAIVAVNLGNDLPAAPRTSFNGQASYNYKSAQGWDITATVDASHKGSEFKRLNNVATSRVAAYTLLNARLDLHLAEKGITLFVYGRNLTDKIYYVDKSATYRLSGAPRVIGAGAKFDF